MNLINTTKTTTQKSKFISYLFKLNSLEELKEIIEFVKSENKKACHVCYGVFFEKEESFKNDGEVGNPGRILLEILKNKNLNSHILIVARIYGGINLGPAGVGKAFWESGLKVIDNK